MNQTEQVLLQAIQKSLWNTDITFPTDTDWDAVLKEAYAQAVLGIAIAAAPEGVQKQWKSRADGLTIVFIRILHEQGQLCKLLNSESIPFVILKGMAAAVYYPNPAQRTMGDIDFIVPEAYFDRAKNLLIQNGYSVEDDPRYPRHIAVTKGGISFEMHRFFSEMGIDIESYILEGIPDAETEVVYDSRFPMLPKLANGLVLLAHLAFHMKTGLGLRQVIDWMLYVDKVLDNSFWDHCFKEAAEATNLDAIAVAFTKLCKKYLGLSNRITWCDEADDILCNQLLESFLSSGNFGVKRGKGKLVENTITNLKGKGILYLQQAGEFNWSAYHKHKWLKPFCWVYQIGRYAKQGIHTKRNARQIKEDVERGKARRALLKQLKLDE